MDQHPHVNELICCSLYPSWWRHQMETFSALLAICVENSPVPGEFPAQRPVTRSFDVYIDLRPNRRLSKQSWGWWFETASWPLWRHRNVNEHGSYTVQSKTMQCYSYPVSLLDQPNAYWVIVLTSYSGTICVLNKLEDLGQYHPHAKPSKMMSVYSYPARLVNTPYGVSIVKSCRESWLH